MDEIDVAYSVLMGRDSEHTPCIIVITFEDGLVTSSETILTNGGAPHVPIGAFYLDWSYQTDRFPLTYRLHVSDKINKLLLAKGIIL